jgi:hypothetical protein
MVPSFQYHVGHGVWRLVGKSEKRCLDTKDFQNLPGFPINHEKRFPHGVVFDFNVNPLDPISESPTDRFEEGLFGCKPEGETF